MALLDLEGMDRLHRQLLTLLQGEAPPQPPPASQYLERIAVESRGRIEPVPVSAIEYIVASGPYARLHTGGRRHVIREAMQTLEQGLDPSRFLRVHRSAIVRLDLVEALERGHGGESEVRLKNGVRLRVSRSRREALERWLGRKS